ncbi:Plug domain-containing protein, partial [Methylobacterium sp. Leaf89]|uniref:Plug domain-containing protein n=1 Tax=Methylobacterium sp. Leaf89 TaxID=1736245 RepID=UPI001FCDF301
MAAVPRSPRSQAVAPRTAAPRTGAVRLALVAVLLSASKVRAEEAGGIVLEELSITAEGRPAPAGVPFGVSAPPGSSPSVIEQPLGATATRVGRTDTIENRPATSLGSVLVNSPGVTVRPGNGGRDVVISIRGNNARSTGVIRNMVVLEDGFLLTQPDGASRFDLVDPRAYGRIDVFRGPQSALFGNYATGG